MMSSDFTLQYLGSVEDLTLSPSSDVVNRSAEEQLIDKLEDAQLEGKLPYTASENAKEVLLNVSKHGIKVMDVTKKDVLQRHPLHVIAQTIHYADGLGRFNLVVKTGQPGKSTFNCYIFQSTAEDQIVGVLKNLQQIFNQITQTKR